MEDSQCTKRRGGVADFKLSRGRADRVLGVADNLPPVGTRWHEWSGRCSSKNSPDTRTIRPPNWEQLAGAIGSEVNIEAAS